MLLVHITCTQHQKSYQSGAQQPDETVTRESPGCLLISSRTFLFTTSRSKTQYHFLKLTATEYWKSVNSFCISSWNGLMQADHFAHFDSGHFLNELRPNVMPLPSCWLRVVLSADDLHLRARRSELQSLCKRGLWKAVSNRGPTREMFGKVTLVTTI